MHTVESSAVPPGSDLLPRVRPLPAALPKSLAQISIESGVAASEMGQVRALHAEWFPLHYDETFYSAVEAGGVRAILAKFENEIIGMVVYKTGRPRDLPGGEDIERFGSDLGYIMTLGVAEECRGLRVSGLLLNQAVRQLSDLGVEGVYLHVADYNETALGVYFAAGFSQVAENPDFYKINQVLFGAVTLFRKLGERKSVFSRMKSWFSYFSFFTIIRLDASSTNAT